ncbi:hypothetical protein [Piscirickettsia litoralis]|uniref:Uncharacterized protein n=1 Tax=Piscirickettsia litoralis TaxID=1891921 RepID=A0ABX3A3W1_9GAMM|nr:hypothetical protein [Piscirickettsia litoralis]ODN43549.1 hypothetical protein BGC07_12260 [Piscirickettsia litoralis]
MKEYSPVWPHGEIKNIFENIYIVRGTNITEYEGMKIQHSRNMTIINQNGDLTLINTVRLSDDGLNQLDNIGQVKHVVRIGAFHGRDDAFYLDRYNAEFWAFGSIEKPVGQKINHSLSDSSSLPINDYQFFKFLGSSPEEGFIYCNCHGGIIFTCDSIKNWIEVDQFFSGESGRAASEAGEIAKARISPIWLEATGMRKEAFNQILGLKFKHLISAHGDVLKNTAYESVKKSILEL